MASELFGGFGGSEPHNLWMPSELFSGFGGFESHNLWPQSYLGGLGDLGDLSPTTSNDDTTTKQSIKTKDPVSKTLIEQFHRTQNITLYGTAFETYKHVHIMCISTCLPPASALHYCYVIKASGFDESSQGCMHTHLPVSMMKIFIQ